MSYADSLNKVLTNLKDNADEDAHPLLEKRKGGKDTDAFVISTDKGLCGGLNANLLKEVNKADSEETEYVTVGRKLRLNLMKVGKEIKADFVVKDPVPFSEARPISKFLTEQFLSGEFDSIKVAFNDFKSTMVQEPKVVQLLPIESEALGEKQEYEGVGRDVIGETDKAAALEKEYLFEPSPMKVLDTLLPQYVNFQVYQMLVESRASEHSARMVSMKAATDNANDMVADLTLEFNKLRQAAITAELLEITTAMKAME